MADLRRFLTKLEKIDRKIRKLEDEHQRTLVSIKHITQEIEEIQIWFNESGINEPRSPPRKLTLADCESNIGERVRILNPSFGEADKGKIKKVGRLYVTIELEDGKSKRRFPKNIELI